MTGCGSGSGIGGVVGSGFSCLFCFSMNCCIFLLYLFSRFLYSFSSVIMDMFFVVSFLCLSFWYSVSIGWVNSSCIFDVDNLLSIVFSDLFTFSSIGFRSLFSSSSYWLLNCSHSSASCGISLNGCGLLIMFSIFLYVSSICVLSMLNWLSSYVFVTFIPLSNNSHWFPLKNSNVDPNSSL